MNEYKKLSLEFMKERKKSNPDKVKLKTISDKIKEMDSKIPLLQ